MRAGISTASLFMRRENEEALPLLQSLGVDCAEVFLTSFFQYKKAYGELLKERKGSLFINSVHDLTSQFEPQLFSRHEGVRRDSYAILEEVLSVANALGAPYYSFHGISRAKRAERTGEHDDFPKMVEDFRALSAFCEERGVTLCLENVEWASYNRPGVFSRLAREIPTLKGVLDIKQARISGYPYEEYLEEMGERLAYVHILDVDERGKNCLPGRGTFDFKELVRRLKGVGFDGALLIEAYEKDYRREEELKEAYEYIQGLIF